MYNIIFIINLFKNIKLLINFLDEHLENDIEFKIYNSKDEQDDYFNKWNIKSF